MSAPLDSGARRGEQVRCPGCTRFISADAACPHCLCGSIPPERYGSARELLKSGVDRFALAARTAALEPSQVAVLEARYARQWGVVTRLAEDVRRLEAGLMQRGFSSGLEDSWALMLPMDDKALDELLAPLSPMPDSLEWLADKSPDPTLRNVAALAWVHQGTWDRGARATVHQLLLHSEGPVAVEAMLALTRWRNGLPLRLGAEECERIRSLALGVLEVPEISSRAAVAWSRVSREAPPEAVTAALHRGLYGSHTDIRLECALCLHDEVEVAQSLESPDPDTAYFVRRILSQWGSPRLFAKLRRDGDAAFAKEVLRGLPTPSPEGALEALLTVSVRTVDAMADELLSFAKRRPFREWGPEDQKRWARWARAVLRGLPAETALAFFDWAATPPFNDPEAPEEEETEAMWAFLEETVHAIDRGSTKERIACFQDSAFTRFLHHSGVDEQRWLNAWARAPDSGGVLLEALVMFPSREERVRPEAARNDTGPGHAGRLLMAVWEGPEQHLLVAPMAKVARSWSAYSGREKLVEAVWLRFQSHPSEREALLTAFAGWRDRFWELQRQAEPDALARFQTWWRVDPKGLYPQTEELLRDTPESALPRGLRALWDAAEELVATRPRTASLSVSKGAMALRNALESRDADVVGVLDGELEHFEARFPAFERRVLATPSPPEESDVHRDFLDDTHGALRMMRERRERRREAEEREREREIARKVAESRRRDQERQAEDARRAAEAQAAVREQQEVLARVEAQRLLVTLQPRVPPAPVDREVLFPQSAFPTLVDYARMIKAMQRGADVMKLFDTLGLTPVTWAAQANAWGQMMVGRMELAMRFGELLQAPWE
jgi:cellulose synthase operon protein C